MSAATLLSAATSLSAATALSANTPLPMSAAVVAAAPSTSSLNTASIIINSLANSRVLDPIIAVGATPVPAWTGIITPINQSASNPLVMAMPIAARAAPGILAMATDARAALLIGASNRIPQQIGVIGHNSDVVDAFLLSGSGSGSGPQGLALKPAATQITLQMQLPQSLTHNPLGGVGVAAVAPHLEVPQIALPPQLGIPATDMPQMALLPKLGIPATDMPHIALPKLGIPATDMPQIALPKLGIPATDMPHIALPKLGIPATDSGSLMRPRSNSLWSPRLFNTDDEHLTFIKNISEQSSAKTPGQT